MSKRTSPSYPFADSPSWDSLVLICKDCRSRKDGPKHVKARALAKDIKHEVKESAPRARVVISTCLKLCPNKATSVAYIGARGAPRITAIKSRGKLKKNLSELLEQRE